MGSLGTWEQRTSEARVKAEKKLALGDRPVVQWARVTNHTVDRRPEGVVTCEPPKPGA